MKLKTALIIAVTLVIGIILAVYLFIANSALDIHMHDTYVK